MFKQGPGNETPETEASHEGFCRGGTTLHGVVTHGVVAVTPVLPSDGGLRESLSVLTLSDPPGCEHGHPRRPGRRALGQTKPWRGGGGALRWFPRQPSWPSSPAPTGSQRREPAEARGSGGGSFSMEETRRQESNPIQPNHRFQQCALALQALTCSDSHVRRPSELAFTLNEAPTAEAVAAPARCDPSRGSC